MVQASAALDSPMMWCRTYWVPTTSTFLATW